MKTAIISGILAAMMVTGTATSFVASADNCVTAKETYSKKSTVVRLDRLKDCTFVYPEFAQTCGEPYVAELVKDRTIKGKLQLNDGETLYVPAGTTLTLNSDSILYGGTIFVEKGASLVIKGALSIFDGASLVCDGSMTVGRSGKIQVYDGGILYSSPDSSLKLNSNSYMYSYVNSVNVILGEVTKVNGLTDSQRRTFCPSIVSAVRVTRELGMDVLTSENVKPQDARNALSAKWYTLSEIPAGNGGDTLTVLFDNGSAITFSFIGERLFNIEGTSVRDIWNYASDKLMSVDDDSAFDDSTGRRQFTVGQFDMAASESTNVVTAKLDSYKMNSDTAEYWFTVTSQLKGEAEKKLCVKRDIDSVDEYKQEFEKGKEYLLFLRSVDFVYSDLYYNMTYSLYAPITAGKLTKFCYNGGKYAPAEEISTVKQVEERVNDNLDMDSSQPIGYDYLRSDDISQIISKSPYIVKVKITDDINKFYKRDDVSIFTVELEKSCKLTPETPLKLILPNDSVKVGEEYVIMLFSYPGWAEKHYMPSSKNSVYTPDDETLISALKKAGYSL